MSQQHVLLGPVVLISYKSAQFDNYISPYTQHIEPILSHFRQEFGRRKKVITPSAWVYMKWATRKLEYSYVLRQCTKHVSRGMKVLDVGCGLSPLPRYFTQLGCDVFGLDIDTEALKILTEGRSYFHDTGTNYLAQSGTNLAFQDGTFDVIVCVSVLEHLKRGNDSEVMREMLRVLAPGGLLVVTVDFNGEQGSGLRIANILNRVLKQLIIIMASGLRSLNRNAIRQLLNEGARLRGLIRAGGPYSIKEICRHLLMPLSNLLDRRENEICRKLKHSSLNLLQIKKFWESHWFEGCLYERANIYVPLGFAIKKLA